MIGLVTGGAQGSVEGVPAPPSDRHPLVVAGILVVVLGFVIAAVVVARAGGPSCVLHSGDPVVMPSGDASPQQVVDAYARAVTAGDTRTVDDLVVAPTTGAWSTVPGTGALSSRGDAYLVALGTVCRATDLAFGTPSSPRNEGPISGDATDAYLPVDLQIAVADCEVLEPYENPSTPGAPTRVEFLLHRESLNEPWRIAGLADWHG